MKIRYTTPIKVGDKFGKWTVINASPIKTPEAGNRPCVTCRCDCGTVGYRRPYDLFSGKTTGCRCSINEGVKQGRINRSVGDITLTQYNKWKASASLRKYLWDLTPEFLWSLYQKQEGKCALTGVPLVLNPSYNYVLSGNTASLDRIDSSIGYIESNVQFVLKKINIMKLNLPESEFIGLCQQVALIHP